MSCRTTALVDAVPLLVALLEEELPDAIFRYIAQRIISEAMEEPSPYPTSIIKIKLLYSYVTVAILACK
jgi:hypothetical protein